MRDFKRKRKWSEIEDDMIVDEERKHKLNELNLKIKQLEGIVTIHEQREDEFLKDKEKLVILYQKGIINSDGEAIEE